MSESRHPWKVSYWRNIPIINYLVPRDKDETIRELRAEIDELIKIIDQLNKQIRRR